MAQEKHSSAVLRILEDVLLRSVPNYQELMRLTRYYLDVRLESIVSPNTGLRNAVRQLIDWVDVHGGAEKLVEGALREQPDNKLLQQLALQFRSEKGWLDPRAAPGGMHPDEALLHVLLSLGDITGEYGPEPVREAIRRFLIFRGPEPLEVKVRSLPMSIALEPGHVRLPDFTASLRYRLASGGYDPERLVHLDLHPDSPSAPAGSLGQVTERIAELYQVLSDNDRLPDEAPEELVRVLFDGRKVTDEAYLVGGAIWSPLRVLADALGWVILAMGAEHALVQINGIEHTVPLVFRGSRGFSPVRPLMDAGHLLCEWDAASREVRLGR